jgi:nucleoside-diphosphate-sugar epimerase
MTTLVTGSNGFLGAALVERLVAQGEPRVRCLVRRSSDRSRLRAVRQRHPDAAIEIVEGSLASPAAAAEVLEGVTRVHHVAATMSGAPADMFLGTVVASKNLLEAIADRVPEVPVVLVSSFSVYGVAGLAAGHTVDERTPLEPHPELRDLYAQTKLRQERLFWEYRRRHRLSIRVARPGVIYGPGGGAMSGRVGLDLFGLFLHLGGDNVLPLSYVDNCADALVLLGRRDEAVGRVVNVHDDDLPTCAEYLAMYEREVRRLRKLRVPYAALRVLSSAVERYHAASGGQLPAIFTPYKTATTWKPHRFDNARLKALGWRPLVATDEGLRRTFEALRRRQLADAA